MALIEFLIYPVSAVLKFWQWFLHAGLGVSTSTSWLLSIFGLIITVRSIVAPTSWMAMKSGRISQRLRPQLKAVEKQFERRIDADASAWKRRETNRIQKEAGFNLWAGCVPMLLQFPVFIGLYQVLLRMARPRDGFTGNHQPIGFLNSQDINEFLAVRVKGVPLPAYINMPEQQLTELGTTRADVIHFVWPWLMAACVFTTINLAYSSYRGYMTLDWSSTFQVYLTRLMLLFVPLVPFMLVSSALTAPLPVAIILYWFAGNLWTMTQYNVITYLLHRKYPFSDEFVAMRKQSRQEFRDKRRDHRSHKRFLRKKRALGLVQPWRFKHHRAELKAAKLERKDKLAAEKALKKKYARVRASNERAQRKAKFYQQKVDRAQRDAWKREAAALAEAEKKSAN